MAFLYRCPEKNGSDSQSPVICKKAGFFCRGTPEKAGTCFEMSHTHYFTLQNYHKTTDEQSKIRVFCFAHPPSNTNFAETFRGRAVVCSDFGRVPKILFWDSQECVPPPCLYGSTANSGHFCKGGEFKIQKNICAVLGQVASGEAKRTG